MSKGNILSPKEEQIMACLWQKGPLFVREIIEMLPDPKPHFNTVSTFIRGLENKGWVAHEQLGNTYKYHAVSPVDDYRAASIDRLTDYLFAKSYSSLVSYLLESGRISPDTLRQLISEIQ